MTQLIINNSIYLPQTSRDKYQCYLSPLSTQLDMISGRRVSERRGLVYIITYSYDYMGNDLMRQLFEVLRSGQAFSVSFLPDGFDELSTSRFLCDSMTNPTFAFSRGGLPLWHNIGFTLREVMPHD